MKSITLGDEVKHKYTGFQRTAIAAIDGGTTTAIGTTTGWDLSGTGVIYNDYYGNFATIQLQKDDKGKISPQLFFSYIKKKLGFLEKTRLEARLQRVEKAFDKAVENGQNMLAEKILTNLCIEMRESKIYSKGIIKFIERADLYKYKNSIKDGHISDTKIKDFTRVIPKNVAKRINAVKDAFDDFIIFHYWDEKAAEKVEKKEKMSAKEKSAMKDPVVFGIIKETDKLYFVADWLDEYCDLTFKKIVDVIGNEVISKEPTLV